MLNYVATCSCIMLCKSVLQCIITHRQKMNWFLHSREFSTQRLHKSMLVIFEMTFFNYSKNFFMCSYTFLFLFLFNLYAHEQLARTTCHFRRLLYVLVTELLCCMRAFVVNRFSIETNVKWFCKHACWLANVNSLFRQNLISGVFVSYNLLCDRQANTSSSSRFFDVVNVCVS